MLKRTKRLLKEYKEIDDRLAQPVKTKEGEEELEAYTDALFGKTVALRDECNYNRFGVLFMIKNDHIVSDETMEAVGKLFAVESPLK